MVKWFPYLANYGELCLKSKDENLFFCAFFIHTHCHICSSNRHLHIQEWEKSHHHTNVWEALKKSVLYVFQKFIYLFPKKKKNSKCFISPLTKNRQMLFGEKINSKVCSVILYSSSTEKSLSGRTTAHHNLVKMISGTTCHY